MPFDRTSPIDTAPSTIGVADYDAPEPSYLSTLGAVFRQDGLIGSALSNARLGMDQRDLYKVDPNYNVYQDPDVAEFVKDNPDRWDEVYNKNAADAMRANIEKERRDKATIDASGWGAFLASELLTQLTDPTILLPGGALARAGKVGYSAGRSSLALGASAALGTAAQETGL